MTATLDQPQVFADPASVVREYMDGVIDGTIPAARLVIAAVKRHQHDLEHGGERGLWFDEDAAARVIRFCADVMVGVPSICHFCSRSKSFFICAVAASELAMRRNIARSTPWRA